MPLSITQTVAPTAEPLTLDEVKRYLRIDGTDDDAVIESLMLAAREDVETWTGRTLLTTSYALRLSDFEWCTCCGVLRLPRPPLQSVTSISYLDSAGATQTLATTVYQVDAYSEPGRITLKTGQSWPSTYTDSFNNVTVTFVAGWTLATIPERVKMAMKLLIGGYYEHREDMLEVRVQDNAAVCRLLWGLRIVDMV